MPPYTPPSDGIHNLDDIEKETPFVTYAWWPPLCPWCGQWLRGVDLRPIGQDFIAKLACPSYHGLVGHGQTRWVDLRPPAVQQGGDGAWWCTVSAAQLWVMNQIH